MDKTAEYRFSDDKFKYHVFRDDLFVDLNLFQFGWEHCSPMHQFGPAVRNHFLFHYVVSGTGTLDAAGKTFKIMPGQGFLLCPDQITTYFADQDDPWFYIWVEFDGLRARESMTLAGLTEQCPVYIPNGENKILQYLQELLDNHDASPLRLIGLAMILIDEIVQTSRNHIRPNSKRLRDFYIKEALNFVESNYRRDIPIDEVAAACGLNRSYFGRIFKEAMGLTPQQYVINYRMTKASELLKSSMIPISEVSASVGYENQLHFSRAFKAVFGISPREYRKTHYHGPAVPSRNRQTGEKASDESGFAG